MKRLLFALIAILCCTSCDKKVEMDILFDLIYPRIHFAIFDGDTNIFEQDPNTMYEVEAIYNGETYTYHDETRDAPPKEDLTLYTSPINSPYMLFFSDFDYDESGVILFKFRENEWTLEFGFRQAYKDDSKVPSIEATYILDGVELTCPDDFVGVMPTGCLALPLRIK